jgi:hypothetical protein
MPVLSAWIAEAGLASFKPPSPSYRCDEPHILVPLQDVVDTSGIGFVRAFDAERDHYRLTQVLSAIAADMSLPPITLACCRRCLLDGQHRYLASVRLGFTHAPARERSQALCCWGRH